MHLNSLRKASSFALRMSEVLKISLVSEQKRKRKNFHHENAFADNAKLPAYSNHALQLLANCFCEFLHWIWTEYEPEKDISHGLR